MKKLIIALFIGLILPSLVFADASWTSTKNGRAVTGQQGISHVVAIADGSTGYTARVGSQGEMSVIEHPCTVTSAAGVDSLLLTGAYRIYSISAASNISVAGDRVDIYDALTATGTPKYEISLGTAKDTKQLVFPSGVDFSTGVFEDQSANNMLVSVCYDN